MGGYAEDKYLKAQRRKKRVRKKIFGTQTRPRLSVYKSNRYLYAQLINDEEGKTLVFVSSRGNKNEKQYCVKNLDITRKLGRDLGRQAKNKGIKQVVLDRGSYPYHGRIKALTEGTREEGIKV